MVESKVIAVDWDIKRYRFRQTVLHEIAHAIVGDGHKPGVWLHGTEWLRKAEEVGCSYNHLEPYWAAACLGLNRIEQSEVEKAFRQSLDLPD
jgi:hypothetical protein